VPGAGPLALVEDDPGSPGPARPARLDSGPARAPEPWGDCTTDGQQLNTPWDDVHVAYFSGEALWTYLNTPFIYARSDFSTEEIPSIEVDGETWRRLKVTFPDTVKSHTREQISCFGPDGLLRRHDYTVDILQGGTGLNYASDYEDVDGIIVPAKRRIYAYEGDYQLVKEPLLVAIDFTDIKLA
jgi:hypothetical protein